MRKGRAGVLVTALTLAAGLLWPTATAVAGGGGCYGGPTQGTGEQVEMVKACFMPSVLRVEPGTEVTFLNSDPITHNVSAIEWGSEGDLRKGDSFTTTFNDEGTFPYACMYHYGMTGAVVVGDGSGPATGASVEVGELTNLEELPKQPAASVTSGTQQGSAFPGLALAGAMGLVAGIGGSALIRRRRTT